MLEDVLLTEVFAVVVCTAVFETLLRLGGLDVHDDHPAIEHFAIKLESLLHRGLILEVHISESFEVLVDRIVDQPDGVHGAALQEKVPDFCLIRIVRQVLHVDGLGLRTVASSVDFWKRLEEGGYSRAAWRRGLARPSGTDDPGSRRLV